MKQITNVAIGGRNFIISNEAYAILDSWLERFRSKIDPASQADDVMVEIEERIAELFTEAASGPNYVVDTDLVHKVIGQLGMPDGSDPDGLVTREMFVTMLWRYVGSPAASGSLAAFPDAARVSSWASDAMSWAVANGIITGIDGSLSPNTGITRAQAATIFMRNAEL